MHITRVVGIFSPEHGGPIHSIRNYCLGQVNQGHRVSLRVVEGYPHTSPAVRLGPPVDMFVGHVGFPSRLGVSPDLRKQLARDDSPDIYHLHGAWLRAMHYGAEEARHRQVPYLVELMGMYEPYGLRTKWLRKRIARWWFQDALLQRANCLHVNSLREGENLRRLGFTAPLAVIPVGVDTKVIADRQATGSPDAGWPQLNNRPFILFLSRIHPKKGVEVLLEAWKRVASRQPDFLLVMAGTGTPDYVARCKTMAARLGIDSSVLWMDHITDDEKWWAYAKAEAYVLPSFSENFGNSVAEALACGTPVLTTVDTPWDIIEDSGCGWIARPEPDSLAEGLERILSSNEAERRAMGNAGRQLVGQRFSLDAVLIQLEEVYRWLTQKGPLPACVIQG